MLEIDAAWLAGWLEGEGCFSVSHRLMPNGTYRGARFDIQASCTDLDVLERVQAIAGAEYRRELRDKVPSAV